MNNNLDPREPYSFPIMDDCGNGYGETKWDLLERLRDRDDDDIEEGEEDNDLHYMTVINPIF